MIKNLPIEEDMSSTLEFRNNEFIYRVQSKDRELYVKTNDQSVISIIDTLLEKNISEKRYNGDVTFVVSHDRGENDCQCIGYMWMHKRKEFQSYEDAVDFYQKLVKFDSTLEETDFGGLIRGIKEPIRNVRFSVIFNNITPK